MGFLDKLFSTHTFERIVIDSEVIQTITNLASKSHPLEFTALLEGKIKKKTLHVTGLIFQQYEASNNATAMHMNLPLLHSTIGSVHSHPGLSNKPSNTDIRFFNKHGLIHLIIKIPYREEDIAGYDKRGNIVGFTIEKKH